MNVASLFATLGIKVDGASFAFAEKALAKMRANAEALSSAMRKTTHGIFSSTASKNDMLAERAFNTARMQNQVRADIATERRKRGLSIEERNERQAEFIQTIASRNLKTRIKDEKHFDSIMAGYERGGARARTKAGGGEPSVFDRITPGGQYGSSTMLAAVGGSGGGGDSDDKPKGWKDRVGAASSRASSALHGAGTHIMRTFALGYIAKSAIQSVTTLGDEYNNASNRIKVLTSNTAQQVRLQDMLFASSQRTATTFDNATSLYQQIGKAIADTGGTLEDAVGTTELISKAVKGSGANAEGAKKALYQLGQAIGSNRLSGDEFRSVIEQAPILIDIIGKAMGKSRNEMRELAEGQKISAKMIIDSIKSQAPYIEELYANRIPILGDVFTNLRGKISKAFGEMFRNKDTLAGFNALISGFSAVLMAAVDAMGFVLRNGRPFLLFLGALTGAFVALKLAALAAWLATLGPVGWTVLGLGAGIGGAIAAYKALSSTDSPALSERQINEATGGGRGTPGKITNVGGVVFNINSTKASAEEVAVQVQEAWDSHMVNTAAAIQ